MYSKKNVFSLRINYFQKKIKKNEKRKLREKETRAKDWVPKLKYK